MSTNPPGVRHFLDAGTMHITDTDSRLLAEGTCSTRLIRHEYGWFIHVPQDPPDQTNAPEAALELGFSESYAKLLEYAMAHDCWWINLDQDADEIAGLPTHEW